jgi:hypothetical protein
MVREFLRSGQRAWKILRKIKSQKASHQAKRRIARTIDIGYNHKNTNKWDSCRNNTEEKNYISLPRARKGTSSIPEQELIVERLRKNLSNKDRRWSNDLDSTCVLLISSFRFIARGGLKGEFFQTRLQVHLYECKIL